MQILTRKWLFVFAGLAVTLLTVLFALTLYIQQHVSRPLNIEQPEVFVVERGQNSSTVIQSFIHRGWITDSPLIYKLWRKISAQSTDIKAGAYQVSSEINLPEAFEMMVSGDEFQYSVSLIEGLTFNQWLQSLKQHPAIDFDLTDNLISEITDDWRTGFGSEISASEGVFLADTYYFTRQTKASVILRRALSAMITYLKQEWPNRALDLPFESPYQALILASIIEKETAVSDERKLISGVFVNRLRERIRLQTDPTVIYGLGDEFDGNLTRAHLKQPTPYNTYTNHGLPPTPIAMAGKPAIQAALNPATTAALYFVARGDGTHVFSSTLEEHNRAVYEYQIKPNKK